jgi:hypothetical protein
MILIIGTVSDKIWQNCVIKRFTESVARVHQYIFHDIEVLFGDKLLKPTVSVQVSFPKINVQVMKLWVKDPLVSCLHLNGGKGISICHINMHLTDQR